MVPRNFIATLFRLDHPDDLDGVRVCESGSRRFAGDAELYDQLLVIGYTRLYEDAEEAAKHRHELQLAAVWRGMHRVQKPAPPLARRRGNIRSHLR